MPDTKINIAVFVGGTSPEREVSKSSGKAIYKAIKELGYKCTLIDPAYGIDQPDEEKKFFSDDDYSDIKNENIIKTIHSNLLDDIDLVFIALHGKWGEDGIIQSLLELRGIKYTGSGVFSSTISMDKALSKIIFKENNVNNAESFTITNQYKIDEFLKKINTEYGYPCVIKPNDQGSTVGLTIVSEEDGLKSSIDFALQFSDIVLVEKYIAGREMTVAILDDEALPVLEIIPKSGFYDYKSKYTSGMSEYIIPADIPEDLFKELQEQALIAFKSLRCKVYGRVDFRLSEDNIPYCLEINTLPGMTATSLVPKMANAVGISFNDLIERIIRISIDGKK
jgi:D-alanine-D-alanine ligase